MLFVFSLDCERARDATASQEIILGDGLGPYGDLSSRSMSTSYDPRRALREAEQRRARIDSLRRTAADMADAERFMVRPRRATRNGVEPGLDTSCGGAALMRRYHAFGSTTARFDGALRGRPLQPDPTPTITGGPGHYDQTHNTVVTIVGAKANPFEFGTTAVDPTKLTAGAVDAEPSAQTAQWRPARDAAKALLHDAFDSLGSSEHGLQALLDKKCANSPHGWLRADYHRWLCTARHDTEGTRARGESRRARQQIAERNSQHRANGAALTHEAEARQLRIYGQRQGVRAIHRAEAARSRRAVSARTIAADDHEEARQLHARRCVQELSGLLLEA